MSATRKPASEKLNDSVNVPINRGLKRRLKRLADHREVAPTRLAREFIADRVAAAEAQGSTNPANAIEQDTMAV